MGRIGRSLSGAWAIMRGDPDGMGRLDLTVDGFWNSFRAVALIAPFTVLAVLSQNIFAVDPGQPPLPFGTHQALGGGIALLADWFTFPLLFALVAKPLGLASRFVPFIVARNWAAVLISAAVSLVHALHLFGVLPAPLASLLLLIALVATLRFSFIIARTTLVAPLALTIPIVAIDFLLSFTIWAIFQRLIYG